ncbi:autotransporter domain-containing protein [Rhizobium sp. S152]|uniref:autotransporter domain-containing protein n=1 Tax=Rhizobium sp. S152 TaxID=3055038 RepID=UPI0025A973FD|nr:autotransporter domain-containing protein [Rhizobium sp. S152]MDM9625406.1 autotransporter domain-containing protein [Rhizobium sp. S152]
MSLNLRKRNFFQGTALCGIFCAIAASTAFGQQITGAVALSDNGATALERVYGQDIDQTYVYRVVDVATGQRITLLPDLLFKDITASNLSANGKSVIGTHRNIDTGLTSAFVWTKDGNYVDIGLLEGQQTTASGISANGSAVVGTASNDPVYLQGYYWSKENGIRGIGYLDGGSKSSARAISADGSTVVGWADTLNGDRHAVMWIADEQFLWDLDQNSLYDQSSADLVSSDGSVIAGAFSIGSAGNRVFRWTELTGMQDIGDVGTVNSGRTYLNAMSEDGRYLVGNSTVDNNEIRAFRYDAIGDSASNSAPMRNLGVLEGGNYSNAKDVSDDGSVVVGQARDAENVDRGFRWTEDTGMQTVEDWLAKNGANIGNFTTSSADFVSADGKIIMGTASDYTAYIARLGSGIINPEKFLQTVGGTSGVAVGYGISNANTIMFGAQGEPMRNLLATGQKSVWGTFDGGYDNGDVSDGGLGLGEFGFGYGIADGVTARLSGGGTFTKQNLDDDGGDVRQRGFYLSPEVSANVGGNIYVTAGGYWGRGSIDSHRGYLNGAVTDFSDGSTNSETWGAKLRFDWLNAVTINDTAITPYAALSYTHTKVDGFAETNGSFPVSYDGSEDHSTVVRIGADFVRPLTEKVRLLAKAEADYQFENRTASTSGTIIGLSDFNLDGQDQKQFWLRGGVGAEFDVGKASTASVMVNATTQGQDPDVWVRTNLTVKF